MTRAPRLALFVTVLVALVGCTVNSTNPATPNATTHYASKQLPVAVVATGDGKLHVRLPTCSKLTPASLAVLAKPDKPITSAEDLKSGPVTYWVVERDTSSKASSPTEIVIGDVPTGFRETHSLSPLPQGKELTVFMSWAGDAGPNVATVFSAESFIAASGTVATTPTGSTPPGSTVSSGRSSGSAPPDC